ncbi:MAG TPA: hypothetical protein PKO06_24360 [Candidatus Ozemobacteraceae bacterium]|nr:hypothetical protein [Candidatus Ozemobacteraceae bacterium]
MPFSPCLRDDPDLICQPADDPIRALLDLVCKWVFYLVVVLLFINFDTKHRMPYSLMPYIWKLSYFGLGALILKHTTDNHYAIDLNAKTISYHFHVLFFRRVLHICKFKDVDRIMVDVIKRNPKDAFDLEYQIILLHYYGHAMQMRSFSELSQDKEDLTSRAIELSQMTGIPVGDWGRGFFAHPTRKRMLDPIQQHLLRRSQPIHDLDLKILIHVVAGAIIALAGFSAWLLVRFFP